MGLFKFLKSLRTLAKNKNITIEEAYKFAKQEFGEVSDLLKLQINKIFKDVEAPSIKLPKKTEGKVVPIKPESSPLMSRLEKGAEVLKGFMKPGLDMTTGMARTAARVILDNAGIKVPEKVDPLKVVAKEFGEDVLLDLRDVADELLEKERTGKITESMGEFLSSRGMFDLKRGRTDVPKGYTDEEMKEIEKAIEQEDILLRFDPKDREPNAVGGRVGFALGSLPKGIQALVKQINKKFGKGTIKTADEMERPKSVKEKEMFEEFEARNPDPKRKLTDDEIKDYEEELGDSETWMSEGTVEEAEQALKRQKEYEAAMYVDYRAGRLDPKPGEKGRKEFLEKKMEEMEMSGDKKLMTRDEIEELSTFDLGEELDQLRGMAPKMAERFELQKKYPGIDDRLLTQIIDDPDPQRKAEALSVIDQAFELMKKGKSPEEVLDIMKQRTDRTKQAGGGLAYLMGL
jgi:tetratricopeptide (TPR) repeat protein